MSLFGKKVFAIFNGLMVFAIISIPLFLPNETLCQSVNWTQIYHDDYGRPLYTGGTSYPAPTFVDIDGDGDYDYFQGCRNGTIWFFENVGMPDSAVWHFVTEKYNDIYFDYFQYATISFADVDADGDFDMFVGGETSQDTSIYGIHFFRNDGDPYNPAWTFVTTKYHNINTDIDPGVGHTYYSHTQFVDIDNDGDQDLFFVSFQGRIAYYKNTGTDSLPNYILINDDLLNGSLGGASRLLLNFCDIDDDSDFDLFIGSLFYKNAGNPDSAIWQLEAYNYYDLDFVSGAAFYDIDNDLDYDTFVGLRNGQIYQFENAGTPDSAQWQLASVNAFSIDVGDRSNPSFVDIDNDGLLEMFITNAINSVSGGEESIWFYQNNGTPSTPKWTLASTYFDSITYHEMSGLSFVDIDNDGDYDIFLGYLSGNIIFHENFGDANSPQFSKNGQIVLSISDRIFLDPAFADIDSDGDYDMFISERDSYAGYGALLHFYRNDGDPYQPIWTHFFSEAYPFGTVTFFDEDADGDLDMFYGGWGYENGNVIFYKNIGDIYNFNFEFVTAHYDSIDIGPPIDRINIFYSINYSPVFADIDSDGDLDLIIGEADGGINLFRNDGLVGINEPPKENKPGDFELYQNYPNPFNPSTEIRYAIPTSEKVRIVVYNILGQKIKMLLSQRQPAGEHHVVWDGRDDSGQEVSSGIYFYQLQAGEFREVKRALLLR